MTEEAPYGIALAPTARRTLAEDLSEPVATAIIEFLTGALIARPRVVGKPLVGSLTGVWSARRGVYRVLYRIDESQRTVLVIRIDHRSDAYRP
ncbi:MAG: type II toxin-antitoxin system RelE family toxin [Candidatus Nanopelagicales bacterium]